MIINEQWIPVLGYEGHYEVSNEGNIRRKVDYFVSRQGAFLRPIKTHRGYVRVSLSEGGRSKIKTVHRIVLSSFTGEDKDQEINHKDGCKENNSLVNLEWCSRLENVAHAKATGLYVNKLTEEVIAQIKCTKAETGYSNRELGRVFGLSHPTIAEALKK